MSEAMWTRGVFITVYSTLFSLVIWHNPLWLLVAIIAFISIGFDMLWAMKIPKDHPDLFENWLQEYREQLLREGYRLEDADHWKGSRYYKRKRLRQAGWELAPRPLR